MASPDDAAVYKISEDQAIISTMDFFPPVVDDPYHFGAIAAANALSDIYAMGGTPLMAINLVAYPDGYGLDILTEILRGGAEKVLEADAVVSGGHTVTDKEPKYGLSVTGRIRPDKIIRKGGAKPGDQLILTKPLGTGIITTAHKRQQEKPEHLEAAIKSMSRLNRAAARSALSFDIHAMTDITGYSLLGHGHEMAHLSEVDLIIHYGSLKWLPGVFEYAERAVFPGGTGRNQEYFSQWVELDPSLDNEMCHGLLYDPQTSGGLLIALPAAQATDLLQELLDNGENAAIIGEVQPGAGKISVS